jgi:hypothetical protein
VRAKNGYISKRPRGSLRSFYDSNGCEWAARGQEFFPVRACGANGRIL